VQTSAIKGQGTCLRTLAMDKKKKNNTTACLGANSSVNQLT
jgi:hypothetical protein